MSSALPTSAPASGAVSFTSYEKLVIAVLAFLQFTIVLDFMILSPLGAMLIPALDITAPQFGLVVSGYAFSAGTAGLLTAGFADRYDRKKLLLVAYAGFLLGTFSCAVAPTYEALLGARVITGAFGGVVGSAVFAICTDLFPVAVRGRVMGLLQTSFAASQILGIPLSLSIANRAGWHAPFMLIVGVGLVVGVIIVTRFRPVDAHLAGAAPRNALAHLLSTLTAPRHGLAFATTALLATGGFMLMPFGSAFSVRNLGISMDQLSVVYFVTGVFSVIAGPFIGRMSDKLGSLRTFVAGSIVSLAMILFYTQLGVTPLWVVIVVSIVMFTGISARMISSQALLSAIPAPASRGSFMSVSSCVQQLSGGVASVLAGAIVVAPESGPLRHFDRLGYVVTAVMVVNAGLMFALAGGRAPISRSAPG